MQNHSERVTATAAPGGDDDGSGMPRRAQRAAGNEGGTGMMSATDAIHIVQERVAELYRRRGYDAGAQTLALGVMEEVGELAMALLLTECDDFQPSRKKMSPEWADARDPAREAGDAITYILALCNALGVTPTFKWEGRADEARSGATVTHTATGAATAWRRAVLGDDDG